MTTVYDKLITNSTRREATSGGPLKGIDLAIAQRTAASDLTEASRVVNNVLNALFYYSGSSGLGGLVRTDDSRYSYPFSGEFTIENGLKPSTIGIEGRNILIYTAEDDTVYSSPDFDTLHPIFIHENDLGQKRPNTVFETVVALKDYVDDSLEEILLTFEPDSESCITNCAYTKSFIGTVAFDSTASTLGEVDSLVDKVNKAICRIDQMKDDVYGPTYAFVDHRAGITCEGIKACTLESKVNAIISLHGGDACATGMSHTFFSSDITWDVNVAPTNIDNTTESLIDRVTGISTLADDINRLRYEIARLRLGDTVTPSNGDADKWDTDTTHTGDGSNMGVAWAAWTGTSPFGTNYVGVTIPYSLDGHMGCMGTGTPSANNPHGMHITDLTGYAADLWTDDGDFLYPTSGATHDIVIGATSQVDADNKLEVIGQFYLLGDGDSSVIMEQAGATGTTGYALTIGSGEGADGNSLVQGATGGLLSLSAGDGGYRRGTGGGVNITAGTGGNGGPTSFQVGGTGGALTLTSGLGGNGGASDGGDGGLLTIKAGDGGHANSIGAADGGDGGDVVIEAGEGGVEDNGGTPGVDGYIKIGENDTTEIQLGVTSSGAPTSIYNKLIVQNSLVIPPNSYSITQTVNLLHTVLHIKSGGITLTLPTTAKDIAGKIYIIKDTTGFISEDPVTIATQGSETIDGVDTLTINYDYQSVTLQSDGTNWYIL